MSPESMNGPILEARGLSVIYGRQKVLDVPHVQVAPNKVTAIIGPNGSGKTTLLLCLSLLLKPTAGNVFYKGQLVDGVSTTHLRRNFAIVFQEPLLLNMNVWENVTLGLRLRGVKSPEIQPRAEKWLKRFGIRHLATRHSAALSGGEAQRASLARAFALEPEILFLDEPFAALDVPTRQSLFGDMVNILQETNFTTVLVTHDRNEARTLAHHIKVLMDGSIVQEGTPRDIFTAPATEKMARFVGVENVIEGVVSSNNSTITDINVDGQTIEGVSNCEAGRPVYVCIRPEDVTISLTQSPTSARNVFSGKITSIISSDPLVRINLDCGFPLLALITRISFEGLQLEMGKTVYASFKATAIHVIKR